MTNTQVAISRIKPGNEVAYKEELQRREHKTENIWFFRSPKNDKNFVIAGDTAYVYAIVAEGDPTVGSYIPKDTPVQAASNGTTNLVMPDFMVTRTNGATEWWEIGESEEEVSAKPKNQVQKTAAKAFGALYFYKTRGMARTERTFFTNWQGLIAAMNRCAGFSCVTEKNYLKGIVKRSEIVSLGTLLEAEGCDRALMHAAIGEFLQRGLLEADLKKKLFGALTLLKATGK